MRARRAAVANGVIEVTLPTRSLRSLKRHSNAQLSHRSTPPAASAEARIDRCSSDVQIQDELVAYRPPVHQAEGGGGDDVAVFGAVEPETSTQRLEREIAEIERRIEAATARSERVQQAMNDVLAKELKAMRDMVDELDRDHEAALAAVRLGAEAEAARIVAEATAFVEPTDSGVAQA